MVLIGVGLSTALSGASITIMSTFDQDQMEFIARWFAGNIWGDECASLYLHLYHG